MLTHAVEHPNVRLLTPIPSERTDRLVVCLLGSFRLLRDGEQVESSITGKAATLLSALALRLDTGIARDTLLELLWPEQARDQAANSLHSLIYSLHRRMRIGDHDAPAVVHANGAYALNRTAGVTTDIARYDALIAEGNRFASFDREADAAQYYERAITLYRGDLTTGYDVFAVIERERLRTRFLTMLSWLADRALSGGDCSAALDYALRLLACEPCREDAHRIVMRAHVHRGERAQALRQYRVCEHVLRQEFDASPESATTELFDQIRINVVRC